MGTSDSGTSWSVIRPWIPGNSSTTTTTLATQGTTLVAGTDSGIYVSTDLGTTWQESDSGFPCAYFRYGQSQTNAINSFAITNSGIFVGTELSGVYRSTDNGVMWLRTTSILSDTENAMVYNVGENIFVQISDTSGGVYHGDLYPGDYYFSSDQGESWNRIDTGLQISNYMSNPVVGDGYLFIGNGHGVWRRPLSDFGISSVAQTPVVAQSSIQSFPNPFTESTTISFSCDASGYAEVSIVNALGAEVARLYAGELDAGNHSFKWNADGLAAGNYLCVMRRNGSVQTLPIAMMR